MPMLGALFSNWGTSRPIPRKGLAHVGRAAGLEGGGSIIGWVNRTERAGPSTAAWPRT